MADRFRFAALHVVALSAFAVAQPLYDLLGRNAEFLVAHSAGRGTLAALVAVLSLGIPLALVALVGIARLAGPRPASWVQVLLVAGLSALIAAGLVVKLPAAMAIAIVVATASAAAFLYRVAVVRTFLTVVSPAALIFPVLFLTTTPVAQLMREAETHDGGGAATRTPSIVLVIFDELDTLSLMDGDGAIDGDRYPNFAALARTATWFPNAIAAFPYTNYAIPAILTGVAADGSKDRLPVAANYPDNLFTWLGTQGRLQPGPAYHLHVQEPFTSLCPPATCGQAHQARRVNRRALASDIAVLYAHLVTPKAIAERRLPSLDFLWKGFGETAPAGDPATPDASVEKRALETARAEEFRSFVAGIEPVDGPALHFIHALLPHDPYEYLASGRVYPHGGRTTGLAAQAWVKDRGLIETGRRRHIEQLRFVDRLLGELVAKLESASLFDRAMVIVLSDHGGAFQPDEPHRALTAGNYREMLPAAMFVKAPGQRTGRIDVRRVSGLDVLPTIADTLGAQVPWQVDGVPMFGETFPERGTIEYTGVAVPPLAAFDVREEARRAARARRSAGDIEPRLLGRLLSELEIGPPAPGRYALSDNYRAFGAVSLQGNARPALVQGVVVHDTPPAGPLEVAIAVNGIVRAVTETGNWNGASHFFSALVVADDAFREGSNRLDVFAVERDGERLRLSPIPSPLPTGLRIQKAAGTEQLAADDGTLITLRPQIGGWVERVDEMPDTLRLNGWAADQQTSRDLRAVVAFSGGRAVAFGFPQAPRPDVVAALSLTRPARVGFAIDVPRSEVRGDVRVFGLSADGQAGELQIGDQGKALLSVKQLGGR